MKLWKKISPANMGVVLKRMMLRAAERVAEKGGIEALVTGEAVAQVSSQTISNLAIIDRVTERLILRPLIATDKTDIIQLARNIGVEDFSANIPEYCGVIAVKPSAKVKEDEVIAQEAEFDFDALEQALQETKVQSIDEVMKDVAEQVTVEKVSELSLSDIVIDIRHPDEQELNPLNVNNSTVLSIPFYKLSSSFEQLDKQKHYYLYCEKGVMSELHAAHLKDAGHNNVGVYRP